MSRYEGKIGEQREQPVDAADVIAALAKGEPGTGEHRRDAISRYLSASEGWKDASEHLSGAFAPSAGLTPVKDA